MSQHWWKGWMVLGIIVAMSASAAIAEEAAPAATGSADASSQATTSATPAAPATPVTPPAAAPEAPAAPAAVPVTPELRPIVIKFSGEVVQLNKQNATQPVLTVRDRYGVTKDMVADPSAAKVSRGSAAATLDDLKTGDQVSVEYTYDVASGKRHVQSVTIAEASAAAPAPAKP